MIFQPVVPLENVPQRLVDEKPAEPAILAEKEKAPSNAMSIKSLKSFLSKGGPPEKSETNQAEEEHQAVKEEAHEESIVVEEKDKGYITKMSIKGLKSLLSKGGPEEKSPTENDKAEVESQAVKEEVNKDATVIDEKDKAPSNIMSIRGFKSLISKSAPSEKPSVETDIAEEGSPAVKEEDLHEEKSKSFTSALTISGFKSLLTKGGHEVAVTEEIVNTEVGISEKKDNIEIKIEEKSSTFSTALSVAGLKSLLSRGHEEISAEVKSQTQEVEKVDKVECNLHTTVDSKLKEDSQSQPPASDSLPPGMIYHQSLKFILYKL